MEIVICAIARLENRYIKEWVDYHLSLGFSHIYLYDNNRKEEERIAETITKDYYNNVTIIPYHNVDHWPQVQAYKDCWERFKFDWVLFIDIDEFFTFGDMWKKEKRIETFIKDLHEDCDAVLLNWMCFGDNGLIEYDNRPLVERFKKPLPLKFSRNNMFGKQPINGHVKTLVRHRCNFQVAGPHVGTGVYKCYNAEGIEVSNEAWLYTQTYTMAYLRHYMTKTISEYVYGKMRRGMADRAPDTIYSLGDFFFYNKPTISKFKVYNKYKREKVPSFIWWLKLIIKHYIITPLCLL